MSQESSHTFFQDPFCVRDFRARELRRHLPRLAVAFAFYCSGLYVNNLSQAWLQKHFQHYYEARWAPVPPFGVEPPLPVVNKSVSIWYDTTITWQWPAHRRPVPLASAHRNETVTLWDLGFNYFSYVNSSMPANMFAGGSAAMATVRFAILPGPLSMRWAFLCRSLAIWGMLFVCRAFTTVVTPLPNPYHQCVPKISYPDNIWLEALAIFPGVGNESTCQDVMFSGHTTMGTLFTLSIIRYAPLAPWSRYTATDRCFSVTTLIHVLSVCWCCWGYYVITASRLHYTIDVIVGVLVTLLCFNAYHYNAKIIWFRKLHPVRASMSTFLRWFERYSPDLRLFRLRARRNLSAAQLHLALGEEHRGRGNEARSVECP